MNKGSITIHAFSPVQCQVQSDSDAAKENAILLSRGRAIARAGCATAGWQMPNATRPRLECILKNAFTYLPTPPLVLAAAPLASSTVGEWGTRPSESEKFSIADLKPFESTSLRLLHSWPPVGNPASPKVDRGRCSSDNSSPSRPPTKRIKVDLDTGPLDELILLPHYVPAPLNSSHPLLLPAPLDSPPSFAPVPPQTRPSIDALFSSIYSRLAWLIPIRGPPPWEGASRASVALGDLPIVPTTRTDPDITWTRTSLRQFWAFLRSCSETSADSVTGPLSLSFHAASRPGHTESQGGAVLSAASACHPANRESEMTDSDNLPLVPISCAKSQLTDIDYMKVYCDAPRAMSVRQTLGQWAYGEGEHAGDPRDFVEGTRILEFAKLVLVDERGEGVLVS